MSIVIKLVHSSDPNRVFDFLISSSSGVDIGEIGRRLGVNPATIRLNGHFLSTTGGTHRFVSTVTWDSLLSFFSTRGFSTGTSDCDAIVVQGKPASSSSAASDSEANGHLSSKRKMKLEDESPVKRNRVSGSFSSACKTKDEVDVDSISIDRRLKLDDDVTAKRPKISHVNSGFVEEASKIFTTPSLYGVNGTCNCTDGLRKRYRDEELVLPVSCKKIK